MKHAQIFFMILAGFAALAIFATCKKSIKKHKISTEILKKASDDTMEQIIFDALSLQMVDDSLSELEEVKLLNSAQQAFYVTWRIEGEVNNGGFNQFYYNPTGLLAPLAVNSFNAIGAKKHANVIDQAQSIYAGIKTRLDAANDGTMESFSKSYKDNPLNACDKQFFALNHTEDISKLRIKFIRDHWSEFTE